MNRDVALVIAVLVSTCSNLAAQRGGEATAGVVMAYPWIGVRPTQPGVSKNFGYRYSDLWLDPNHPSYADYWDLSRNAIDYFLPPLAIVRMPAPQTPAPESPLPPPPTPAMHEYSWPESGGDGGNAFAIVSKNGIVQSAIAVWVQNNRLCFITPDGIGRELPLEEVDRQNTTRINTALKLKLPLPIQDSRQDGSTKITTAG
jgi:hypothetical protein